MAELGGSGLLGAGLLGALLVARRRSGGGEPSAAAAEAEVWLRVGADPERAQWLNRALRGLPAACRQAGVGLPNVYAAVLDDVALELLVAPAATWVAAGWTAVADGARWRLERHVLLPETSDPCPYPALVSLGRDVAGRDILLQLGACAGPVAVTGSPAAVTAVVAGLAVELATSPWSDPLEVTVTDLPALGNGVAGARLRTATLTEALQRLASNLGTGRGDDVLTGRRALDRPEHLVVAGVPEPDAVPRLRGWASAGLGVLAAGELEGAAWRLQVDDAGNLSLPELGIAVTANRLGEESLCRLHELLAAATSPGSGHQASPGDPATRGTTRAGRGPRSGRPQVPGTGRGADDAAWAVAAARVGVLGPVLVRAEGRVDAARADQIAELIAFLARHPGGVHPNVLAGAIWPRGVTADVRDATIERARDWLGTDELGGHRLRADADDRLWLAAGVVVDWDVACTLLQRSRAAVDARTEADLAGAEYSVRAAQGRCGTRGRGELLSISGDGGRSPAGVSDSPVVLLRLSCLAVWSVFTVMRVLPVGGAEKDVEILALRHQLAVLQRQIDRPRLTGADRVFLAALLRRLPRVRLRRLPLIVSSDTILRWHRDLIRRRHAKSSRRSRLGRPPTRRSIQALVLRLAMEYSSWGCRRIHGELAMPAITLAPSTVWEILKRHGIGPAPDRDHTTWSAFLRGQAQVIVACDLFTATTLTGVTYHVLAVIEHAGRRVRVLGVTAPPTVAWVTQLARNLVMGLQDAEAGVTYLVRDRDTKSTQAFDAVFAGEGCEIVTTGVRVPRMNSIIGRWIQTCRHELLDRTLIWNLTHLLHALREFETFFNRHRLHHALHGAAPLRPRPQPVTDPARLDHLDIRRRDRLGGTPHQHSQAA
jgi:putative transposase